MKFYEITMCCCVFLMLVIQFRVPVYTVRSVISSGVSTYDHFFVIFLSGSGILINKRNHEPKQTFRMPKSSCKFI